MSRLLIVSESPVAADWLRPILAEGGFEIVSCPSAESALRQLESDRVHLVLSHLAVPKGNFELSRRVKAVSDATVCFVLLDRPDPEMILDGLKLGIDGFLTRDLTPEEVIVRFRRELARGRSNRHPFDDPERLRDELLTAHRSYSRLAERFDSEMNQRTRAEQDARRSRQRFELAVRGSGDGIWDWDLATDEVFFSTRWKAMLGHEDDEIAGRHEEWEKRLHPEDRERALATIRSYLHGNAPSYELEHRLRHKDGSYRWIRSRGVALRDPSGKPYRMAGSHTDVTEEKRNADLLARERDLLAALMDHIPDAIYFKDTLSRFVRINRSMAERFGLKHPDEAIGKRDRDFFDSAHADEALRDEQKIILSGTPVVGREEHEVWPDGREAWALTTKMPWRDPEGMVIGTFGISRDITRLKKGEESLRRAEARARLLLESSSEGIFGIDTHGTITFVNQAALDVIDLTAEAVLGKNGHDLVHHKYPDGRPYPVEECPIHRAMARGELCRVEDEVFWRGDGTPVPVEYASAPQRVEGSGIVGGVIVFTDITERKRAEAELRKAKEDAIAASRAKSEFLANMSHEIRTPMNAIIGMSELLRDTELAPEQREYLEMVRHSADALLSLINDILDFSKIEAGKLDLDSTDFSLRETLGDTLHTLSLRAYQKGLELVARVAPEVPDDLRGDPGRLRQVVMNLVGNALKFTEKGEVVVDVELLEPVSESAERVAVHFAVRDTGIGIPREKQSLIFAAFSQADSSTTRKFGGTGLGLTISTRLVQLMGGQIWVESEPGKGSTFHFTAGFEPNPNGAMHRDPDSLAKFENLLVLIVDDNATNRRILEETLSQWRMRPVLADGASAALKSLAARAGGDPFDLILLDAHMPEMDGFELAARIFERPDTREATILMLTSGGQPGDVARCQELGLAAYLTKPVKQDDLRRAILRAMNRGEVEAAPISPPPQVSKATRTLRVLLAEDNPMNQKLATRLLEKRGHSVTVADDGRKAVAALGLSPDEHAPSHPPFDLVLMDVQMPEMDGLEATALIRDREKAKGTRVPIVAMTAHAMKGDEERCLRAGMDFYLSKPIKADALFAIIESLDPNGVSAVSTEIEVEPSRPEAVDWGAALSLVRGDEELLRELAEIFLSECPRWRKTLHDSLAKGDSAVFARTAHTLKGSLGTFAAKVAKDAAEQLETLGREKQLEAAPVALAKLEIELASVLPALESRLKKPAN